MLGVWEGLRSARMRSFMAFEVFAPLPLGEVTQKYSTGFGVSELMNFFLSLGRILQRF